MASSMMEITREVDGKLKDIGEANAPDHVGVELIDENVGPLVRTGTDQEINRCDPFNIIQSPI